MSEDCAQRTSRLSRYVDVSSASRSRCKATSTSGVDCDRQDLDGVCARPIVKSRFLVLRWILGVARRPCSSTSNRGSPVFAWSATACPARRVTRTQFAQSTYRINFNAYSQEDPASLPPSCAIHSRLTREPEDVDDSTEGRRVHVYWNASGGDGIHNGRDVRWADHPVAPPLARSESELPS